MDADGSGSYAGADGSSGSYSADGSSAHTDADGNSQTMDADGSGSYTGADGSSGSYSADGSSSHTDADGNTTAYEAEGNMGEGDQGMGAMDQAFGDDGADKGTPPPTDDPMGAAMDESAATSDAGSMPEAGQGGQDPMADVGPQDDGVPKVEEDDQSGGVAG